MARSFIPNPDGNPCVDHVNGDKLDNRVDNLRWCTYQENGYNSKKSKESSSPYKGVHWHIKSKKWESTITINGKVKHIGYFSDEIEAAKAYDQVARKLHREFARLNFPVEE